MGATARTKSGASGTICRLCSMSTARRGDAAGLKHPERDAVRALAKHLAARARTS